RDAAAALPVFAVLLMQEPPAPDPARGLIGAAANLPARAAGWVDTGLHEVTRAVRDAGQQAVRYLPGAAKKPAAPGKAPSYLEGNLGWADVALKQLVTGLGMKLPFRPEGRATVRVQVAFPLDAPQDLKTYRLNGNATLPWLVVEGLRLEQVKARVS